MNNIVTEPSAAEKKIAQSEQRKYNIVLPDGRHTTWTQEQINAKGEELAQKYPKAEVHSYMSYDPKVEYDDSYIYNISLPDGRQTNWNKNQWSERGKELLGKYPDAQVTVVDPTNPVMEYRKARKDAIEKRIEDLSNNPVTQNALAWEQYRKTQREIAGHSVSGAGPIKTSKQLDEEMTKDKQYQDWSKTTGEELRKARIELAQDDLYQEECREKSAYFEKLANECAYDKEEPQNESDKKNYGYAEKLNMDTAKIYAQPFASEDDHKFNVFIKNAGAGVRDTGSDVDFWTMGITELVRDTHILNIFKRLENKGLNLWDMSDRDFDRELTPGEKALVYAFVGNADAQAERAQTLGYGYNAGVTATDSIAFMAQFFLAGGVASGASKLIGKAGTSGLARFLARGLSREGSQRAIGNAIRQGGIEATERLGIKLGSGAAGRTVARKAVKAAGNVAEGVYKYGVRPIEKGLWVTALAPSTYVNLTNAQLEFDENGERTKLKEAFWPSIADSLIENWSEMVGEGVQDLTGLLGKGIGAVGKKTLGKTTFGQWGRWMLDKNAAKTVLGNGGFNGFFGEMAEEWIGNAARVGVGLMSKEDFNDFASLDNQVEMAAAFAPMSLFGLATDAVSTGLKAKEYKKISERFEGVLANQGYTQEEIDDLMHKKFATQDDVKTALEPVLQTFVRNAHNGQVSMEDYRTVLEFANASAQQEVLNSARALERERMRESEAESISQQLGATPSERTDENGSTSVHYENEGKGQFTHMVDAELPGGETVQVESVTVVTDEKGNQSYFVGSTGTQVMLKDAQTGEIRFMDQSEYNEKIDSGELTSETSTLENYLDERIRQKIEIEEKVREDKAHNTNRALLNRRFEENPSVNLGTEENPLMGNIISVEADGVVVDFGSEVELNGIKKRMHKISYEQAARAADVQLVTEKEAKRVAKEIERQEKEKAQLKVINTHLAGKSFVHNGQNYTYVKGVMAPDSKGMITVAAMDEDGVVDDIVVRFDSLLDQALSEQKKAQMQSESEAEVARQSSEQSAEDGVLRDFRGNEIPLDDAGNVDKKAFKKKDIEAYYRWNDERRGGNTADSMQALQADINERNGRMAQIDKALESETDPDMRDELLNEKDALSKEVAQLDNIYDRYAQAAQSRLAEENFTKSLGDVARKLASATTDAQFNKLQEIKRKLVREYYSKKYTSKERAEIDAHMEDIRDALSDADVPVTVTCYADVVGLLEGRRIPQKDVDNVLDKLGDVEISRRFTGTSLAVKGFKVRGEVFVFADPFVGMDGTTDIENARVTYFHERQHVLNRLDGSLVRAILGKYGADASALYGVLEKLIGPNAASIYSNCSAVVLADEVSAFTMERVNTDLEWEKSVESARLDKEYIELIKNYVNGKDNNSIVEGRQERPSHDNGSERTDGSSDGADSQGTSGTESDAGVQPRDSGDGERKGKDSEHTVSEENREVANTSQMGESAKAEMQINSKSQQGKDFEISIAERREMEKRITDWLSEDNLSKGVGKTRDEIFELFGNALEPIAYIPIDYISLFGGKISDSRIYCGKGYFIDHALRNHGKEGQQDSIDDIDVSKYLNIQSILDNPDSIKETFVDGKRTIVFIKKIGRYFAELTQVEEGGKIVLHKSFFNQKKEPYAKIEDIRSKNTSSEGGVSSISHTENSVSAISLESRGDDSLSTTDKGSETSEENKGKELTEAEADRLIFQMEEHAQQAEDIVLTPENWLAQFGEDGIVETPIGKVKMGENQYFKLARQGRSGKLGMVKPTLVNPDVIIIDSEKDANDAHSRGYAYVFVKTFVKSDGSRFYYFTSVMVNVDNHEVVISNQEKSKNRISKLLQKGNVTWIDTAFSLHPTTQIEESVPLDDSRRPTKSDNQSTSLGINSSERNSTTDKGSETSEETKTLEGKIAEEESKVDTNPSEAQKEAGNYRKGHIQVGSFDITIENPKGSVRSGVDAHGNRWETEMNNTYGYIRGTEGVDGDHIDVFLSDNPFEGRVYVVDQVNPETGEFDEHKVMYGFNSEEEARKAYLANYSEGWKGLGNITEVSKEDFEKWINSSHRKTKPFAEYKGVNAETTPADNNEDNSVDVGDTTPILANVVRILYNYGKKAASKLFQRTYFDVAKTPDFMKGLGITGSKFTIKYGVIARHATKDAQHNLSQEIWDKLPNALQNPFAITRYFANADRKEQKGYRIYTSLQLVDGSYVVVGAEVRNAGRDLEVNSIDTIFGKRDNSVLGGKEEEIYRSKEITPEQSSLLERPNSAQYPTEQELSNGKVSDSFEENKQELLDFAKSTDSTNRVSINEKKYDKDDLIMPLELDGKPSPLSVRTLIPDDISQPVIQVATYDYSEAVEKNKETWQIMGDALDKYNASMDESLRGYDLGDTAIIQFRSVDAAVQFSDWIKRQAEREGGALSGPTSELSSKDKGSNQSAEKQVTEKIDDVGEKIGGARKDLAAMRIELYKKMSQEERDKEMDTPDKVLSVAQIKNYVAKGKMSEEDGAQLAALNQVCKTCFDVMGDRYVEAVKNWVEGKPLGIEAIDAYFNEKVEGENTQYDLDLMEQKRKGDDLYEKMLDASAETRKELSAAYGDLTMARRRETALIDAKRKWKYYKDIIKTYKDLHYPAVQRNLGGAFISKSDRYGYYVQSSLRAKSYRVFDSYEQALEYLEKKHPAIEAKTKEDSTIGKGKAEDHLYVGKSRAGRYIIKSRSIPGSIALNNVSFTSKSSAEKYLAENRESLAAKESTLVSNLMGTNIGSVQRVGKDWRQGKDISADEFRETFGFRGVEFGNYVTQVERADYLNKTYDAIMDFCESLGISPKAFSLNGELGLAFGARGTGSAAAHYEPMKVVINLTKTQGVGSLAHEWWHALDNYLVRSATGEQLTYVTQGGNVQRMELRDAFRAFVKEMESLPYRRRSIVAGDYWGRTIEMTARVFEVYMHRRLAEQGVVSPVLTRDEMLYEEGGDDIPMPSNEEMNTLTPYLDHIFDVLQERVDESTGNVVLFQIGEDSASELTGERRLAYESARMMLSNAGIPVEELSEEAIEQLAEMDDAQFHKGKSERADWLDKYVFSINYLFGEDKKAIRKDMVDKINQARREAKKLYENVLSGNFNDVTLRQINDYIDNATNANRFYRPVSRRLPERALLSLRKGERTCSIDALFSRICESAVPAHERTRASGRRAIEARKEELLEAWAKATGNWHEGIEDFTSKTTPVGKGTDSEVFLSDDGSSVIKASKGKFDNRRFPSDIDYVNLFNAIFPGSAYRILGYGRMNGEFVRFLEQPFVDFGAAIPLTAEERVKYMGRWGFTPRNEERTMFSNGKFVVSDLQKGNIVRDADGNVRVIDADVKLHTKDMGGDYSYPPVEMDTEVPELMTVYHGSGGRPDGTSNYVIFNENDLVINDRVDFLRDGKTIYGMTLGDRILINEDRLNPNTPVHEYTHIWDRAVRRTNPELWSRGVELMKQTSLWKTVSEDVNYADLDENGIASEVHSRLVGEKGEETLNAMSKEVLESNGGIFDTAAKMSVIERLRSWLKEFWYWVKDTMTPWSREEASMVGLNEFVNMPMADLARETRIGEDEVRFSVGDIAKMETPILKSKGTFKNLKEAEQWAKENLQGKEYRNKYTQSVVSISGKSIKEMLAEKFAKTVSVDAHMAALQSVPDFIKTGIPAEIHSDTHGRGYDVMRLYNAIEIGKDTYRVKSTIKKLNIGERYYTYEIEEMEVIDGTQSSAVGLDGTDNSRPQTYNSISDELIEGSENTVGLPRGTYLVPKSSSINSITGAKLLKGVKKTNSAEYILPEIEGLPSYTSEEVKQTVRDYIEDVLAESGFDARVLGLELIGSRMRGNSRGDSDLDAVVEYEGTEREDDMFNLLHDEDSPLEIDGVRVDINPIRKEETGTLDDYMERSEEYDREVLSNMYSEEEGDTMFSIRETAAPKKTGIGYKVFVLKDGKLYPPMVANPNGAETPVGVWLDADAAPIVGQSKTGRNQVKAGGKGTQGGSGKLAYRPGWHLGVIPYALQFNRINPETGERELFPANFVWAEVEYANDKDYQEEAMSYGINASGKFQHSLAGLPRIPENGSYRYRTNPNPETDPWIITGAMKVNRLLTPSEVDAMVEDAGREPQQRQEGAVTDEQINALNAELEKRGVPFVETDNKGRRIGDIRFDVSEGYTAEEQSIIDKAKADGTYMKAPNGKPTNLKERQWAQVRTKAFKAWFGDWEKTARIEKLRNSKNVEVKYTNEYPLNSDAAQNWIKDNLRGDYAIEDTGEVVSITRVGAEEVTSHSRYDEAHLKSISAIPEILKKAIFLEEAGNAKGNGKFDSYRYYAVGLDIDGELYTAKVVVGVKQGKKYYDHRLTQIEKGTLIDNIGALSTTLDAKENAIDFTTEGNASLPPYIVGKDTKLLSILKNDASKVVDENGEPKVVYHGTIEDKFTVFNKKYADDLRSFFFTDSRRIADGYADRGEFNEATSSIGELYDLYLNMRNPLIVEGKGSEWFEQRIGVRWSLKDTDREVFKKILDRMNERGVDLDYINAPNDVRYEFDYEYAKWALDNIFTDEEKDELEIENDIYLKDICRYLVPSLDLDSNCHIVTNTRTINELAEKAGYDGVIFKDIIDSAKRDTMEPSTVYALFDANRIKSAVDNTGDFSVESDDIRFDVSDIDGKSTSELSRDFDRALDLQKAGKLPSGYIYKLGYPSLILRSTGFPYAPIELAPSHLTEKMEDTKHPFGYDDVKGLVNALQYPMAVFSYGNKDKAQNVIVKLTRNGKNFVVGVHFNQMPRGVVISDIRGLFPKDNAQWINWINQDKALYLDKAEIQALINQQRTNLAEVEYLDLDSIAKVIKDFENPKLPDDVSYRVAPEYEDKQALNDIYTNGLPSSMDKVLLDIDDELSEDARWTIAKVAADNGFDFVKATADYLAGAEIEEVKPQLERVREMMREDIGDEQALSLKDVQWALYQTVHKGENSLFGQISRMSKAEALGHTPQDNELLDKVDDGTRFSISEEMEAHSATDMYNRASGYWRNRIKEGLVDMNESVNDLVNAIEKQSGLKADSFEDIRLALNQQSSRGLHDMNRYTFDYLEPMWDAIKSVMKATDLSYDDVSRYVILKHALERNVVFARRDARNSYKDEYAKLISGVELNKKEVENRRKQAIIDEDKEEMAKCDAELVTLDNEIARLQSELQTHLDEVEKGTDKKFKENRKNDYSGLTSMYSEYPGLLSRENYASEVEYQQAARRARKPLYDKVADMEKAAEAEVRTVEAKAPRDVTELWTKINAATKATLTSQYRSNMLTKEQYESVRDQFQYYVPLRGFTDVTAEDVWDYYNDSKSGSFAPTLVSAKGRTSQAENPFIWIGTMASTAIAQNLKNRTKLSLYYFVANRADKQDLVTIRDVWYKYDEDASAEYRAQHPGSMKRIFTPVYPPVFTENLDSDSAKAAYDLWEESMKQEAEKGNAYRGTQRMDVDGQVAFVSAKEKPQHIITMKVRGREMALIINGNPRAAQAINGALNIETSAGYQKVFGPVLRFMSAVNTSYNPEFWISNAQRDILYAWMSTMVQGKSGKKFFKNLVSPKELMRMARAYKEGTLGDSKLERYYQEFAEGGGITGFTVISGNEVWEKKIQSFLEPKFFDKMKNGKFLAFFQDLGESIEQMSRFSAYITARDEGKSIADAVSDSKEITVNFNRKGSGKNISIDEVKKLTKKNGSALTKAEQAGVLILSQIAPAGRSLYMFFNAGVQGCNNLLRLAKRDPKRFGVAVGAFFALGALQALIHAMIDDDDDYLDMPENMRRDNILLGAGGVYLKWAMPQEMRSFYALGDIYINKLMGRSPDTNAIWDTFRTLSEPLPINLNEGVAGLMPSYVRPLFELVTNKDYSGRSIYNGLSYMTEEERSRTPRYKQAYGDTSRLFVDMSHLMNVLTGGDEYTAGAVNIIPESIQHLVESYGGGLLTTLNKTADFASGLLDLIPGIDAGVDLTVRRIPFLNRVLVVSDDNIRNSYANRLYYYYKGEAEHTKKILKQSQKDRNRDAYRNIVHSKDFEIYKIYEKYRKAVEGYQDSIKEEDNRHERKLLMRQQDEIKKQMIRDISDL